MITDSEFIENLNKELENIKKNQSEKKKPIQYYKVISLQFKKKKKKNLFL